MKKLYQDVEMEILLILEEDIVRTSPNGFDDVEEDPFAPNNSSQSNFG